VTSGVASIVCASALTASQTTAAIAGKKDSAEMKIQPDTLATGCFPRKH